MRNREVEAASLELCEKCVPLLWANVQVLVAANARGHDVCAKDAKQEGG